MTTPLYHLPDRFRLAKLRCTSTAERTKSLRVLRLMDTFAIAVGRHYTPNDIDPFQLDIRLHDFDTFTRTIGLPPTLQHTLDPNTLGWVEGRARAFLDGLGAWTVPNTTTGHKGAKKRYADLTLYGRKITVSDIAKIINKSRPMVYKRLAAGESAKDIVENPILIMGRRNAEGKPNYDTVWGEKVRHSANYKLHLERVMARPVEASAKADLPSQQEVFFTQ